MKVHVPTFQLSIVLAALAIIGLIIFRETVGDFLLELVILGKVPMTDIRIGFFGSVMLLLTTVSMCTFYLRDYSFQLTAFKIKKHKEVKASKLIQPTIDLGFEEAIEELEATAA